MKSLWLEAGRPAGPRPTSSQGTLTIHLGGRGGVVPLRVPPVGFQIAALSARAFQHVHDLAPVDVPQGGVQVLHCRGEGKKGLRGNSGGCVWGSAGRGGALNTGRGYRRCGEVVYFSRMWSIPLGSESKQTASVEKMSLSCNTSSPGPNGGPLQSLERLLSFKKKATREGA